MPTDEEDNLSKARKEGRISPYLAKTVADQAQALKAANERVEELEKELKDAKGWRKHYEKESEHLRRYAESYGRRLTAVKEAYYSEDVPPEYLEEENKL